MSGQFQELLRDVARKLEGVEVMVKDLKEENRELKAQNIQLVKDVAALEEAKRWTGEERRNVAGRLETGDQTFRRIDQQIKDAENTADRALSAAQTAIDAIEAHTDGDHGQTKKRKQGFLEWAKLFAPYVVPALISGLAWLFYHLRFLAELAAKEGRP